MSIGIYAFLRIYFLSFGSSAFAQFRTCPTPFSAPPPSRSPGAACLVSSADRCSVSSVRAVVCPDTCPPLYIRHGLPCCLRCAVCPGALGLGSPPAGYIAAAQPRPVSPSTTEKIKKTHPTFTKRNPSDCASLQIFRKIQKDPYWRLDCAIIS